MDEKPVPRVYDHSRYEGIAERMGYSQDKARVAKIRYNHDAMIDEIIAQPTITQNELAEKFGYTVPWVSRVFGSDAFQARLHARKDELTDPFLIATVEERIKGLAIQSLDLLADKLGGKVFAKDQVDTALKAADMTIKAMGFGARDRSPAVQNNFVVQLPGKAESSASWAESYGGGTDRPPAPPLEARPLSSTITREAGVQPKEQKVADGD